MNKLNSTFLMVISGLVILVLGFGAGFFYKTFQVSPQLEKSMALIKTLSSKTVLSTVAYGQVSEITGNDITLSYNGDNIKISMTENSPVYSFVNDSSGNPVQKKVDFKQIKIG